MTNREILTIENNEEELSVRCTEIDVRKEGKEAREIISEIKKVMRYKELASLSAAAIGLKRRIFCIDFKDKEIKSFINPVVVNAKGLQLSRETSVLIPNKEFIRPRNNDLEVMYQTPMGEIKSRRFVGLAAIVFQQMIDQLDGLFLSDVGLEIDEDFDNATEDEKTEIINMYLDSLDLKAGEINTDIENDKEAKDLKGAIDFMTSVYKGETKLEPIKKEEENIENEHSDKTEEDNNKSE